jgi:hypothetical protein
MRFEACRFEDEELRELIATGLLTAQQIERGEKKRDKHADASYVDVKIHLKNGLTLDRTLLLYRSELEDLYEIITYHEKAQEIFYTMPPEESVDDILLASYHGLSPINDQQKQEFVTIFRREYEAASKALKEHALDIPNNYKDRQGNFVLTVNGKIDGKFYSSRYYITCAFPESYAFLKQYETDPSYPETEYETQYDKEYDGELITIETTYNE